MPSTTHAPAFSPYTRRSVVFTGLKDIGGWQIKLYTICHNSKTIPETLQKKAADTIPSLLAEIDDKFPVYNTGFAIIHHAADGDFMLVNWWTGENMLASRVLFSASPDKPFEDIAKTHIIACVWELEIYSYERDLWVKHILEKSGNPDFTAYLSKGLEGKIQG